MSVNIPTLSSSNITADAAAKYDRAIELEPSEVSSERALYYSAVGLSDTLAAQTDITSKETAMANLAGRQYEVNEWTVNNRRDTLFVLQIVFVGLCLGAILTGIYRKGFLGGPLYGVLTGLILIAIVFVIVRRAQYTNFTRDNRYWNRMKFEKMPGPPFITIPTICPGSEATGPDRGSVAALFRSSK